MSVIINKNNFLRWDDLGNGLADPTADIANGYIRDAGRCDYMPVLKHEEALRFFINTIVGLSFIADTNIKLRLVNARTGTVQNANVAALQTCDFTNPSAVNTFTYYAEVTPVNTIPEGNYYFEVYGDIKTWLRSNPVQVVSAANPLLKATSLVTYRHDTWFYGIRYNQLATFTHQYRLHLNVIEEQEESSVETYTEVTTGKRRNYSTTLDLVKTVESYYFDEWAHRAAITMYKHDTLLINGRAYIAKDSYKKEPNPLGKLSKATINLYDQGFASINHCL